MPLSPPPPLPTVPVPLLHVALPRILIEVTGPQQLSVQSNIPSPGAWPQIVRLLLEALRTAHEEAVAEAQQAGQAARIVVPNGARVG